MKSASLAMLAICVLWSEPLLQLLCKGQILLATAQQSLHGRKWSFNPPSAQCPRCQLGIALNRARSDQSQIVGFVV